MDSGEFCFFIYNFKDYRDEAHLSTKQPCAGTPPWFPPPDGNRRGPCHLECPARAGPQEAVRLIIHLNYSLGGGVPMPPYKIITKRADFLRANRGKRFARPGFVLLVSDRGDHDPAIRLGITITKKVGNAVIRNRMRRRFRSLMREMLADSGKPGADHILIGRTDGIEMDFGQLRADLHKAFARIAV